jgi:two-component system cell cycle response regulator
MTDAHKQNLFYDYQPKILVVDDEPLNVKLLSAVLSRYRFQVFTSYSGQEAINVTQQKLPDIILLDIMMPVMNGYQVVEILKNNPQTNRIPIILITALDGEEVKLAGQRLGAEEILKKPVDITELIVRINTMFRLKQYKEQVSIRKKTEEVFSFEQILAVEKPVPQERPQILLVEDNPNDVKIIKSLLYEQNYRILVAENSVSANNILRDNQIEVILLDVMLPDANGFQCCKQLKEKDSTQNIPIIIITSLDDQISRLEGINAECDDFLTKPVNGIELRAKIELFLKKKKKLDELQKKYQEMLNSATNDGLTGLNNQLHFKRSLELEVKRAHRHGHCLSLVMIDLDDFKKYNDFLGHLTGDKILHALGQIIQESIRETDFGARYGGEEFAVILPFTKSHDSMVVAEKIRLGVENMHQQLSIPSELVPITVSIGIATYPTHAYSANDLIIKADEMLYQAKQMGKNRVCIYH